LHPVACLLSKNFARQLTSYRTCDTFGFVHSSPSAEILIHAGPLRRFSQALLEAAGVPEHHAALIAESLAASNLRGVDSHGIQLLPLYVEALKLGNVDVHTTGRIASESGACAVYDGQNGLGQVIAAESCDVAIRLAREHGMGFVTVRESNHFGAAAFWAQRMARADMLGVVMCNATPLVAPWQGREPRVGTNPICMALPGDEIWLLDMATTTVALNRIWKAAANNEPEIPAGWAMDNQGVPTTSTQAALAGLPMPLGGYKGTGLAVMVEILCAVLSGGAMATELGGLRVQGKNMRVGQAFIAIDVTRFSPLDEFTGRMRRLRDMIKNTAPAPGFDEVLMAGEPEWRSEAQRLEQGIPITMPIWSKMLELANRLGVTAPSDVTIME
jgi:LDH2 family malate/lactate/ureidoglycolate dehydrogenase